MFLAYSYFNIEDMDFLTCLTFGIPLLVEEKMDLTKNESSANDASSTLHSESVSFTQAITICLKEKYANFNGRARRSEYWYFFLFMFIVNLALQSTTLISETLGGLLVLVFSLAVFIPSLAVAVRRLHDSNKSAWYLLIGLIPLINLVFIYFMAQKGTDGPNKFG